MPGDSAIGLWLAVIGLGVYHGLNPAMGWPLAVANGLAARRGGAVFATVLPLGAGHLLAMAVVLLPFALLARLVEWQPVLRAGAGALVLGFGLYRLIVRRHPRALARIPPTQLAWWSFLMATAHGAALMLLPITLGLCRPAPETGTAMPVAHAAVFSLMSSGGTIAMAVALVHTLAMFTSGSLMAWTVYRWVGLKFLRQSWFNLDALWATSLIVAGAAGILMANR